MRRQFQTAPATSGAPDLFVSTAREKELIDALRGHVRRMVEATYPDLNRFKQDIAKLGLPIISSGANEFRLKIDLMLLGVEAGFIAPNIRRYKEVVALLKRCYPEHADANFNQGLVLMMRDSENFVFLSAQFYHWVAYRKGLKGYQERGRELYRVFDRKYKRQLTPKFLSKLSREEKDMLRIAIRREKEALQFVQIAVHEIFIPANNSRLVESGHAQA